MAKSFPEHALDRFLENSSGSWFIRCVCQKTLNWVLPSWGSSSLCYPIRNPDKMTTVKVHPTVDISKMILKTATSIRRRHSREKKLYFECVTYFLKAKTSLENVKRISGRASKVFLIAFFLWFEDIWRLEGVSKVSRLRTFGSEVSLKQTFYVTLVFCRLQPKPRVKILILTQCWVWLL